MQMIILMSITLTLLSSAAGLAQDKVVVPDLAGLGHGRTWRLLDVTAESVEVSGKTGVRLRPVGGPANRTTGLAVADGVKFAAGVIDVDLKGRNVRQGSFLGVAFNVVDERTFEAVYFRPFNFRAEEPSRQRAVQYIAWPEHPWEKLRGERPGQFEKPVNPAPDPDGWFHVRIEVASSKVRVFVNDAKEPCLAVDRLEIGGVKRPVGLFVDVAEGLFANLKVTAPGTK